MEATEGLGAVSGLNAFDAVYDLGLQILQIPKPRRYSVFVCIYRSTYLYIDL